MIIIESIKLIFLALEIYIIFDLFIHLKFSQVHVIKLNQVKQVQKTGNSHMETHAVVYGK